MKRTFFLLFLLFPVLLIATETNDFTVAVEQMNDGFYSQSISTFQKLYNTSKSPEIREKSLLLLGESYLRAQKTNKSIKSFKIYLESYPEGKFITFANSRIGVAYMKKGIYKKAIYYLEKALKDKNTPYKSEIAVNLAECYGNLGNPGKGIFIVENTLKTSSSNRELLYMELAVLYNKKGNYKKAISAIKNVINSGKTAYLNRAYYLAGEIYFKYGNYEKAINYLNRNLQSYNDYKYPSIYLLGEIYTVTGNYFTATKLFKELSGKSRFNEAGMFGLAWLEYQRGNYKTSLEYLSKISKKSKLVDRKLFYEALCYKQLNNDSLFLSLADSLVKSTSDRMLSNRMEYEKFDYYLSKNNDTMIKSQLKTLQKVNSDYYKLALANYRYRNKKYNDALILFKSLLNNRRIKEYSPSIKYHIILTESKLKRYDKSLSYINTWWNSLSFYHNELTLLKADIFIKTGQYKKSLSLLGHYYSTAKKPYKELALRALAWTYLKMKNYKNGYVYFKKFVDNYPESQYYNEALLELGNCSYNIGKKDEALLYYSKIKGKKEIQKALFRQGKVLYEKGDYMSAIKILKTFVERYPANAVSDDALYYVALAFYNTGKADSAVYYSKKILNDYKNSDNYYDAVLLLGDISYNNARYTEMLNYYSDIIKNDADTIHAKHALNTIIDYFNTINKTNGIVPYFKNNYSEILRLKQNYNIFIANYLIEKGLYKAASEFTDNISSSKYSGEKNFLKGKLLIAKGDTLSGINLLKSTNRSFAQYEVIKLYYNTYKYDSLLYYVKAYEKNFTYSDRMKFLEAYALFWLNKDIKQINASIPPYNSRISIMKLIRNYDNNKNIKTLDDAVKFFSSDDPFTKAYATYLAGEIKYDSGNYNDALGYLLKIKYIYDKADIIHRALSLAYEIVKSTNSEEKNRILQEMDKYEKLLKN